MKKASLPAKKLRLPKIKVDRGVAVYISIPILTFLIGYFWNDNAQLQKEVTALSKGSGTASGYQAGAAAAPAADSSGSAAAGKVTPVSSGDHVSGSSDAAVTLIEYSDLECPFCKQFHPTVQQILRDYAGRVRFVYRHDPLPFHANAQKEAEASECAAIVGGDTKYYEYIDAIFTKTTSNGTGIALDSLVPIATGIGLDEGAFSSCLNGGKGAAKVRQDLASASSAGVQGTPGTFVVKKDGTSTFVNGAVGIDSLKQTIDNALK